MSSYRLKISDVLSIVFALIMVVIVMSVLSTDVNSAEDEREYVAQAYEDRDIEALHEMLLDEYASPECQFFADVVMSGLLILEHPEYDDSFVLPVLFGQVLEAIPEAQFDCEVAL